jgi:hypothetical protein
MNTPTKLPTKVTHLAPSDFEEVEADDTVVTSWYRELWVEVRGLTVNFDLQHTIHCGYSVSHIDIIGAHPTDAADIREAIYNLTQQDLAALDEATYRGSEVTQ